MDSFVNRSSIVLNYGVRAMTTAISSISNSSTAATFDPSKGAARFASKVFSDMDTDTDGKVTKDEFVKGLESKGVSSEDATKQYDAILDKKPEWASRTSYVIARDGSIAHVYSEMNPNKHVQETLDAVKAIAK